MFVVGPACNIKDTSYAWGPKMTRLLCFIQYICQYTSYQKSEANIFDKGSTDVKSVLTFERWHLVTELKLKMSKSYQISFSISPLPPVGTFQLWLHFYILWPIVKKVCVRFLINCVLTNLASCIASTLKETCYNQHSQHVTNIQLSQEWPC